ncbi:TIGR03749 family integrating conjugative element protein [Vibrio sp. 10N.261.46.A3]|uniref:TIGR03749 family integrating conjugative element protein n=1 Tax=Vibrio sp. 10N.261.46.A3 TaxID=3229658 RepID=UPI00354B4EB1
MTRWLLILSCLVATFSHAQTPRAMQWDGRPLPVSLSVNKEMVLTFEAPVRLALPKSLIQKVEAFSLDNHLYLTANQAFPASRLQVERLSDGSRLLIQLSAREQTDEPDTVTIQFERDASRPERAPQSQAIQPSERLGMDDATLLVRHAMQSLYSPSYAIEPLPGVQRIPVTLPEEMALSTFPLWQVSAKPITAWRLNHTVVTAIALKSKDTRSQTLDVREVTLGQGCTLKRCSVSFAHPTLGAKGEQTDNTTVFIVTPGPLSDYLYGESAW